MKQTSVVATIVLTLVGLIVASLYAWASLAGRHENLDIDGWGVLVSRLKAEGDDLSTLFVEPSLHRGPVIPFVFGVMYKFAPFDEVIIVANVIAFGLSVGILFLGFRSLGIDIVLAGLTVLLWVGYVYAHKYVFGYYFAEPIVALISSTVFYLAIQAVRSSNVIVIFICGMIAGILLLSRAPFIVVIVGLPFVVSRYSPNRSRLKSVAFVLGVLLVFLPWPIRNFLVYGAFVPFTTEAGQVIFQGTYVKGDDDVQNNLRMIPEFRELEEASQSKSLIDQDRYWKALALKQILENPSAQLVLVVKKCARFWLYIPAHSWTPSVKTFVVSALLLPLAVLGYWRQRHLLLVNLCTLWIGGLWLFHGIIHSELRYNFPVAPMMIMLSVIGVASIVEMKKGSSLIKVTYA